MYTRRLLSSLTVVSLLALSGLAACGSKDKKLKEPTAAEGGAGGDAPAPSDVAADGGVPAAPDGAGGELPADGSGAVGGTGVFSSGGAPAGTGGKAVGVAGATNGVAGSVGVAGGGPIGVGGAPATMPDLVVSATQQPGKLRTSGAFSYFSDISGRVRRLPAGGNTIQEVGSVTPAQNATEPPAFVVHGNSVFAATALSANTYGIAQLSVTGGAATPFVTTAAFPTAIAADDDNVYYASPMVGVVRVAVASKMQTPLAQVSLVNAIALDATNVYYLTAQSLNKVPIAGGTSTPLATDLRQASSLVLDAGNAYFGVSQIPQGGNLMKVPLSAGQPVSIATLSRRPTAVAINETDAYLASSDGTIQKVALDGSELPVTLLVNQVNPTSIALDAERVYWTVQSGEVRSVLLK